MLVASSLRALVGVIRRLNYTLGGGGVHLCCGVKGGGPRKWKYLN
jgi:hypothetical protein